MSKDFSVEDILNAKDVHLYCKDTLYIVDQNDEAYGYIMGGSGWFHKENFWDYFDSSLMLSYFEHPTKEEAVRIYLDWIHYDPEIDLSDASCSVYSSERRYIDFRISDKKLTLACQDFGPECKLMTGDDDEYEFFYQLDEENTLRFLKGLRIEYGFEATLPDLLKKAFGSDNGTTRFTEFCDHNHIKRSFFSF